MNKKVSIVVPVYNAEEFLGYCLNSLLCQTYANFEIILVNDGSTDMSLQICQNYTKLDRRFSVFSIKNSGVSNARNFGIAKATGDYLTFVDSDDAVNPEYLAKMMTAVTTHDADLVISDLMMVDFYHPEKRIILTGKNFSTKQPLVLNKTEFDKKFMELIWKTSLLESGCGKLFNLHTWRAHSLKLNSQLSLGEDFMINLNYYRHTSTAVFLNEPLYYYNNIDDSSSLSHKYRPDLFDNQMYLARQLKLYLEDIGKLSAKTQEYYDNYVAAYGLNCIVAVLKAHKYSSQKEKVASLEKILADDFFQSHFGRAKYLSRPSWKSTILSRDAKKLANIKIQENTIELTGSLVNRTARRLLGFYYQKIRHNPKRFKQLDYEIATTGVKNTILRHTKQ